MPQGEQFYNPYRWVRVSDEPIQKAAPNYHHQFSGLSGRLWCELQTLTPLVIGDGKGQFVRSKPENKPYIPGTSLKGGIRSLAELVGNAAVPSENCKADDTHAAKRASQGDGASWQLDVVARTFGYLEGKEGKKAFAGLVQFSDALLTDTSLSSGTLPTFTVVVGQPKPEHVAFYPDRKRRKLYHHHYGATALAQTSLAQNRKVQAIPPNVKFAFTVEFLNLHDHELSLLLYCLALEEEVSVTLGKEALEPHATGPVTLTGSLRHKLGGCKPHGAGSVHISIVKMQLRSDPKARYRGQPGETVFEGEPLKHEVAHRTQSICQRNDTMMQELQVLAPQRPRRTGV